MEELEVSGYSWKLFGGSRDVLRRFSVASRRFFGGSPEVFGGSRMFSGGSYTFSEGSGCALGFPDAS